MAPGFTLLRILRALGSGPKRPKELLLMLTGETTEAELHQCLNLLTEEGWIHREIKSYKNVSYVLDVAIPDASSKYPTLSLPDDAPEFTKQLQGLLDLYSEGKADLAFVTRRGYWLLIHLYHRQFVVFPAELFVTETLFRGTASESYLKRTRLNLTSPHMISWVFVQLFLETERQRVLELHDLFINFMIWLDWLGRRRLSKEQRYTDSLIDKLPIQVAEEYRRRLASYRLRKRDFESRIKRLEDEHHLEVSQEDQLSFKGYAQSYYEFLSMDNMMRDPLTFSPWNALMGSTPKPLHPIPESEPSTRDHAPDSKP